MGFFIFNHAFLDLWESLKDVLEADEELAPQFSHQEPAKPKKSPKEDLHSFGEIIKNTVKVFELEKIFKRLEVNGIEQDENNCSRIKALKNMRDAIAHCSCSAFWENNLAFAKYESVSISQKTRYTVTIHPVEVLRLYRAFLEASSEQVNKLIEKYTHKENSRF